MNACNEAVLLEIRYIALIFFKAPFRRIDVFQVNPCSLVELIPDFKGNQILPQLFSQLCTRRLPGPVNDALSQFHQLSLCRLLLDYLRMIADSRRCADGLREGFQVTLSPGFFQEEVHRRRHGPEWVDESIRNTRSCRENKKTAELPQRVSLKRHHLA
jgi:hypothetical protein